MSRESFYLPFKALGWLVIALMFATLVYSLVMAVRYWSGIGV